MVEHLHKAKSKINDEFYTLYDDIEKELINYKQHLKNKVVYCNCDDCRYSNFVRFFVNNFYEYKIKKLISTSVNGKAFYYDGFICKTFTVNGDFRSEECIELLKEADIVCTNPPFSLFREYVAQLVEYNKKFIILGNNNAITYKEIFPLIKENKMWLGTNSNKTLLFTVPEKYESDIRDEQGRKVVKVPAISWFTNLEHSKRNEELVLWKRYADEPEHFPKYDNYDAINVDKVVEIPMDYDGVMGVPITIAQKDYSDFELLGLLDPVINGRNLYKRVLIKRKEK